MLSVSCFCFGAAIAALLAAMFGQPATQGVYFTMFWWSLVLGVVFTFPWGALFSGGTNAAAQHAHPAQTGGRILSQALSLAARVLGAICFAVFVAARAVTVWLVQMAKKHPLPFATTIIGILLVIAGAKLGDEAGFGTLFVFFLLFHACAVMLLLIGGFLTDALKFLGRNVLAAWLYFSFWVVLFTAVRMDDLEFLWYTTPEVGLATAITLVGARIIYGNVDKREWWVIGAITVAFAGYFLLTSVEYDLGENTAWVVAGSFAALMVAITYAVIKGVKKFLP